MAYNIVIVQIHLFITHNQSIFTFLGRKIPKSNNQFTH